MVSTDGLLGNAAKMLLKKLSAQLAKRWGNPTQKFADLKCTFEHYHFQSYPHLSSSISYSEEQNVQLLPTVRNGTFIIPSYLRKLGRP